jgi:MFS transporter, PPP family, 3-phenylpropionic acid transporter
MLPMLLSFWLLRKFGSKKLITVSIIAYFIKTLIIFISPNVSWIYVGLVASIFANGIFYIASVYFINEIVKPNERMRGQALFGLCSFAGLGMLIGEAMDGVLVDRFGLDAMMLLCSACGLISIALIIITSYLHKKHLGEEKGIIKEPDELSCIRQSGF